MGVTGEILSDLVDDSGEYQNCTVALRGKSFLINDTLDSDYNFHYQEHWTDINIREGNQCNPDMYPSDRSRFVTMERKHKPVSDFLKILNDQVDLNIEKVADKIYVLKFILVDEESGEEFPVSDKYDLNYPLYMNPESRGFRHHSFDYSSLDLSDLSLCPPFESGQECSEAKDLSYLLTF